MESWGYCAKGRRRERGGLVENRKGIRGQDPRRHRALVVAPDLDTLRTEHWTLYFHIELRLNGCGTRQESGAEEIKFAEYD